MENITGIYEATLEEDFIVTAAKYNRPFCKARINPFNNGAKEYELTYVPEGFFIYPLRSGDKIQITFQENKFDKPVLFGVNFKFPQDFLDNMSMPSDGSIVTFPAAESKFAAYYLAPDFYIFATETQRVIHYKNTIEILTETKRIMYATENDFKSTIEKHEVSGHTIVIDSSGIDMKDSAGNEVKLSPSGSVLKIGASAIPTGGIGFSILPNCLFTGAPHIGNQMTNT